MSNDGLMAKTAYISGNSIIRTRQLLMYRDWVPRRVRVWLLLAFGFLYQYAGSINLSSMNQMVSEISLLSEDVQMAGYCMIAGITVCFPVMYRLKFALYSRQLFFVAGIGLIFCTALTMTVTVPWVVWMVSFAAGFFKMLGMFGCTSNFRLCVTPARNYHVFFPVVYFLVVGGTYLSGLTTAYLTYYGNWRLMNLFVIALIMIHMGLVYFLMKPDHRPGPYLSPKGLDIPGFCLWSGFLISGMWLFCYGEHYEWWRGRPIWIASLISVTFFALAWSRSRFHDKPYLDLSIFSYSAIWKIIFWLFVAGILQSAPRLLQSIYLNAVLGYDALNVISLNYPILYGVVVGALLSFYTRVKWGWNTKQFLVLTFGMLTFYVASMYFLIDGNTNKEAFYLPLVAVGISEVMLGVVSNVYVSQSVPFSHFFFGLSAIGYSRCGIGNAAAAAIVQRLYNWSSVKNHIDAAENIDGTVLPFDLPSWSDTLSEVSRQSIMISLKECYGYMIILSLLMIMLIMMSTYRNSVTRLIPRMATIRRWMSNPSATGDPDGSVINKESD
jgi:hypothetical protein